MASISNHLAESALRRDAADMMKVQRYYLKPLF